jgi:hypothetical protein
MRSFQAWRLHAPEWQVFLANAVGFGLLESIFAEHAWLTAGLSGIAFASLMALFRRLRSSRA